MKVYAQSGYRSKVVEEAAERAEEEMRSYLDDEGEKMKPNLMFQVSPGRAVRAFKRHSETYEASKAIYTSTRRKEVPLTVSEKCAMEQAEIQAVLDKLLVEKT